jgi:hypothetical protein
VGGEEGRVVKCVMRACLDGAVALAHACGFGTRRNRSVCDMLQKLSKVVYMQAELLPHEVP